MSVNLVVSYTPDVSIKPSPAFYQGRFIRAEETVGIDRLY